MKKESEELLAKEYIAKVECCDECFCEMFCIKNGLRKGREPYSECYKNVLSNMQEKENTRIKDSDEQPTADAVEVVRCKDCQWYDNEHFRCEKEKHFYMTTSWEIWICRTHDPDHFCADGKRKDGDSDGTLR